MESIRDALTSQGSEQDFASENLPPAGVETLNAVAEAVSELVNQQSVASVKAALRIQDLQHDKLTELFKHFITAQKRSPLQFKKYYAVLSVAVQSEIAKRWDIPYKITDRPRTK